MTTWTWYAAGLLTTLVLLALLACVYALIVSNSQEQEKPKQMPPSQTHNADTADYKRNT